MACSSSQSLSSATEPDSESADSVTTVKLWRPSQLVQCCLKGTSSSAAAELLSDSFSDRQQNCLEDYVEASLMLHYNKRLTYFVICALHTSMSCVVT